MSNGRIERRLRRVRLVSTPGGRFAGSKIKVTKDRSPNADRRNKKCRLRQKERLRAVRPSLFSKESDAERGRKLAPDGRDSL